MTIERLQALKDMICQDFMTEDLYSGIDIISEDGEDLLSLIDAEIARQSVTDEDVKEAIEWLKRIKENALNILDWENDLDLVDGYKTDIKKVEFLLQALQQMRTEGCHYCNGIENHDIKFVKTVTDKLGRSVDAYNTPYHYCPNCSRKLG